MDLCIYAVAGWVICGLYLYFVTWPRVLARDNEEWEVDNVPGGW